MCVWMDSFWLLWQHVLFLMLQNMAGAMRVKTGHWIGAMEGNEGVIGHRYLISLVKLQRPHTTSPQKIAEEGKSPYFREIQVGEIL